MVAWFVRVQQEKTVSLFLTDQNVHVAGQIVTEPPGGSAPALQFQTTGSRES